MELTGRFKDLVRKGGAAEPAFTSALLREGVRALLAGDVDVGTSLLRCYVAAMAGFEGLGEASGT